MIKREIKIDGEVFTVRSSTPNGVELAILALKRSVKKLKQQKKKDQDDAI
tara:strand:- start:1055 stop:1204 length:150 start_codon:yes stop_codon:yes gene_type:complete